MKTTSETIVFFGSGPVAARSLELLNRNFDIECVVSKPARSRVNDPVPVLDLAEDLGIKIYTPSNKSELDELISKEHFNSGLAVLIDYGIIVSQSVIDCFPLGIVNSHFSLLPKWRGADPISFAILSGDSETGVSLMLITAGMDEGPILDQGVLKITDTTNSIDLTSELIKLSDNLLLENLPKYVSGELKPRPQPTDTPISYSRKLTKQDGKIDWQKPAVQIDREIRAYIEWPKSYTKLKDRDIIITRAHIIDKKGKPGEFVMDKDSLYFYCGEKALSVDRLKPSGKNEMVTKAFLLGNR